MSKRKSADIKKKILDCLKKEQLTYAQLERKVNTGFRTIKSNCEEMESYGFVSIKKIEKHESNSRPSFLISITEDGRSFLKKSI